MPSLFRFPGLKHARKFAPRAYASYRQYKKTLRSEFDERCVYCCAPSRIKGDETFGVDHYRPRKHFLHLVNEYLNLFYSCNHCNSLKSDFWPSSGQMKSGHFVPNPCEHVMLDHLRYRRGVVSALTNAGTCAVDLLDLNDPRTVDWREALLVAVEKLEIDLSVSRKLVSDVKKKLATPQTDAKAVAIRSALAAAEANVAKLENALAVFIGP